MNATIEKTRVDLNVFEDGEFTKKSIFLNDGEAEIIEGAIQRCGVNNYDCYHCGNQTLMLVIAFDQERGCSVNPQIFFLRQLAGSGENNYHISSHTHGAPSHRTNGHHSRTVPNERNGTQSVPGSAYRNRKILTRFPGRRIYSGSGNSRYRLADRNSQIAPAF